MADGQTNIYDTGIDTVLEIAHLMAKKVTYGGRVTKRDTANFTEFVKRVMSGVRTVQKSSPMDNMESDAFVDRVRAAMPSPNGKVPSYLMHDYNEQYVGVSLQLLHTRHIHAPALDKPASCYAEIADARKSGTTNDCGIVALALVSGVSYNDARAMLSSVGKPDRLGTNTGLMSRALQKLGYDNRVLNLDYYLEKINDAHGCARYLCSAHVKRYPEIFADKSDHRQLWFVPNPSHIFAFTGGATVDDFAPNSRKRVYRVMDVFPMGEHPPKDESMYRGRVLPASRIRSGRYVGKDKITMQQITPENAVLKPLQSVTKTIGTPVDLLPVRQPKKTCPGQFRMDL